MKLGIVVVYYLKDPDLSLLRVHLSKIKEHSRPGYRIFAGDNGLVPAARELLDQTPCVNIIDPPSELSMTQQISAFTDYLVSEAFAAGSTHVAIMHVDSFPVQDDWEMKLEKSLGEQHAFAAILRHENSDTVLSFPACIFFPRDFYQRYKPTMYPDDTLDFRKFLTSNNQTKDCGIGYSYSAYKAGLTWSPLLRTNKYNEHPIISGIYGDLVFHLGGGSRTKLLFRGQSRKECLEGFFLANLLFRISSFLNRPARRAANIESLEMATRRLVEDPEGYLSRLRFGEQ